MRGRHQALIVGAALALGCGSGGDAPSDAGADTGIDAPIDDPDPVLDPAAKAALLALSPSPLPAPPPDVTNAFADNPAAATFGKALFFDPLFSGKLTDGDNDGTKNALGMRGDTGKVACAGCHVPQSGFVDDRTLGKQISLGAGWGRRRAPSLLDVGQARLLMWDGRRDSLQAQVFGPIESPVEMNSSRLYVAEQVFARHRIAYEAIFGPLPPLDDTNRFPALSATKTGCAPKTVDPDPVCDGEKHGMPGDGAEYDGLAAPDKDAVTRVVVNVGKAIAAYERKLDCGTSPFDAWIHGDATKLGRAEQRGAALFVGKARCVSCHGGPFMSDQNFHNVGLKPKTVAVVFIDSDDHGAATGLAAALTDPLSTNGVYSDGDDGRLPKPPLASTLEGAFRTPTLRCVSRRPSFMHTGHVRTLDDVVAFFDAGGDAFGYPGKNELTPLGLTPRERTDLVAFMKALDGPGPAPSLLAP